MCKFTKNIHIYLVLFWSFFYLTYACSSSSYPSSTEVSTS